MAVEKNRHRLVVYYEAGRFPVHRYPPFSKSNFDSREEQEAMMTAWQEFVKRMRPGVLECATLEIIEEGGAESYFLLHRSDGSTIRLFAVGLAPTGVTTFCEFFGNDTDTVSEEGPVIFFVSQVLQTSVVLPVRIPLAYDRQAVAMIGPFTTLTGKPGETLLRDVCSYVQGNKVAFSEMAECEVVDLISGAMLVRFSQENVRRVRAFASAGWVIPFVEVGEQWEFLWGREVYVFFFAPTIKAYIPIYLS